MLHERIGLMLENGGKVLGTERRGDRWTGPGWPGILPISWTSVAVPTVPRRDRFKRPLPDALPGLLTGEYEGSRIPLHTYEALLVVLPLTPFVVLRGGAAIETGPGEICLSNMFELHGARAGAMPCQARFLLVSPDLLQEVAHSVRHQRSTVPHFGTKSLSDPALARALSGLWEELEQPVKSSHAAAHCRQLLETLVQHHGAAEAQACSDTPTSHAIRRVLEHLQRNALQPQSLEELAAIAGLSKSYLVREFHRLVGLPPHAYQLQLRVARAARLLALGLPLSQVAFEAGFADQSHLSRRFKATHGLTPLGFAKAVRPAASPARWSGAIPFNSIGQDLVRRVV